MGQVPQPRALDERLLQSSETGRILPKQLPQGDCRKRWACIVKTSPVFKFLYRSEFSNSLIEHELDHVLLGYSDTLPQPNPAEVEGFRYVSLSDLEVEMKQNPDQFTVWFRICFGEMKAKLSVLPFSK